MSVFGEDYAGVYDLLYADKDYAGECDLIERLLGRAPGASLVDFGCGTGRHAVLLARRGFRVTGVDLSPAMLRLAEARRADRTTFVQGDMRSAALDQSFDAVLCMFAALGYQTSNRDAAAAFATFRRHARPGAPLLFDCWYGPAVLRTLPERREKKMQAGDTRLHRTATPELDSRRQLCTTHYELRIERPGREPLTVRESHTMRFFFALELESFLEQAGFGLESIRPFPDIERPLDDSAWNVIVAARAR